MRENKAAKSKDLSEALAIPSSFTVTMELCSSKRWGLNDSETLLENGLLANSDPRIQSIAVGDCLRNGVSVVDFATNLVESGIEPIIYFSLHGKGRRKVMRELQRFHDRSLKNILIVGGDYQISPEIKSTDPVFDFDSVQALMKVNTVAGKSQCKSNDTFLPNGFFSGCVVSPFKAVRQEQIGQYVKLARKVKAGAKFVVTQIGYDFECLIDLKQFCTRHNLLIPILVNLFIPGPELALNLTRGKVPGVNLSQGEAKMLRANYFGGSGNSTEEIFSNTAKRVAVIRGLGFDGVHLGGPGLLFEEIPSLLDQAEEYTSDWETYYDEINTSVGGGEFKQRISKSSPLLSNSDQLAHVRLQHPLYSFSWLVDWTAFVPEGVLFPFMKKLCRHAKGKGWLTSILYWVEKINKVILYGCRMCGDCTLYSSSFVCMEATCPKKQLNGPCGGSINGFCEVYPNRKVCRWVQAYRSCPDDSLEYLCKEPSLQAKDITLDNTSSWINYFTGRDHRKMDEV